MENTNTNNTKTNNEPVVRHEGIVSKVSHDTITISLKGNINCEGCKAKSACGVSESNNKEIEVSSFSNSLNINENVEVHLKRNLGLKAVFWAYVLPFIFMMVVLLVASFFVAEWVAGLFAVAILVPYYLLVLLFKPLFKKTFQVSILKLS